MSKRLPNLIWLRTFEAAARHLNFTAAAAELGLTQTAVSLHLKALETKLGSDLFIRKPRNLQLIDLGRAYLSPVRKALDDLNYATLGLFGPEMTKAVTVRVPVSTTILWLAAQISEFRALHPNIPIRLISVMWGDTNPEQDVDVDLRMGHGDWPGLQVEKLSSEEIVPICGADIAERIKHPKDLLEYPLIHILGFDDLWSLYFASHGVELEPHHFGISVDVSAAAIEMVENGGGVATMVGRYADGAIAAGRRVVRAGSAVPFAQSHYLVRRPNQTGSRPEVTTFTNWLRECFARPGSCG